MRTETSFLLECDELHATATIPLRETADADAWQPHDQLGPLRIVGIQVSRDLDAWIYSTEFPLEVELQLVGGYRYAERALPGDIKGLLAEAYYVLNELPNASYQLSFERRRTKVDRVVADA